MRGFVSKYKNTVKNVLYPHYEYSALIEVTGSAHPRPLSLKRPIFLTVFAILYNFINIYIKFFIDQEAMFL
jgi:hypothetical protein